MQLTDLFDHALIGRAAAPALDHDAGDGRVATLSFGDLERRSNQFAAELRARGLATGDRLCVYLANRVEFIDLWLACVKLGAMLVPINVLYREREIAHIVGDAEPRVIVTTADAFALFPAGSPLWDVMELSRAADAHSALRQRLPLHGDTPAALVYTSGTTGRSKGAVLTHNNFMVNATSLLSCWRFTADDRYLAALPLFHVHGLGNGIMCWLASGCRMRLVERFDIERMPALFDEFRPTVFFGVPTMYVRLMEIEAGVAGRIGSGMRLFVCGSAPLSAQLLEAFRERYGHTILERYGMSETLMNLGNPYDGERRPGSVGFAFPGVRTRIVNAEAADVATGEIGELLVKGPNVCAGYWRREDANASAFVDGWFRTGDIASCSADGYFTLHGRRSDLIISGGFNIYPREIEEFLLECPGVREAAVVGVPDARRGEVPVAYVVCDGGLDAEMLAAACRQHLASFKLPRAFVAVGSLPRTALGKVQKHLLPAPPPLR